MKRIIIADLPSDQRSLQTPLLVRDCIVDGPVPPITRIITPNNYPWHDTNRTATVQKLSCHEN